MAETQGNSNFHIYVVDNLNDSEKTGLHDLPGARLEGRLAEARE